MSGSLNECNLIGNCGKDPEVRALQNGDKVANFSMAMTETWRDKNSGEKAERTEWVRISVFGNLAEIVEKYVRKGSKLYVSGALQTRKWTDNAGVEKFTTEVVLQKFNGKIVLLSKPPGTGDTASPGSAPRGGGSAGPIDDSIPFAPSVL